MVGLAVAYLRRKTAYIWGYGGTGRRSGLKNLCLRDVPVQVRLPLLKPSSKISHMTTSFMLSLRLCNGGWNRFSGRDIRDLKVTAMPQGLCDGYPATLHLFFCVCYYIKRPRRIQGNMNGQQFYEVVWGRSRTGIGVCLRSRNLGVRIPPPLLKIRGLESSH